MKKQTLLFLQSFGKTLRVSLLQGIFGYTSQCKHSPTCGDYCFKMMSEHGIIKGLSLGFRRLATCW
ncbi:membrane protein insertion efficiency factor YidD [Candidatus Woesebacteria bacterium]|nr:membrane protein insertion efficiency factor YidD [Candidatus Woesebacteria bacterium]